MPKAIWNGTVVAESDRTVIVEGNHYFPPDTVNSKYLKQSKTRTNCPWKGIASWYDLVVDGQVHHDAAWYYPDPKREAMHFKDHVAFWRGVVVES